MLQRPGQVQPLGPQRDHQPPALGELLHPRRRDAPGTHGHDDPIERAVHRRTELPVRADHTHIAIACGRQAGVGAVGDLLVDVERGHRALRPDQLPKKRRVVATGPDLQNPLPRPHLELTQHHRLYPRRGDRADEGAVLGALGDDGAIGVGILQRHLRREQVPGHGPQRGLDLPGHQAHPFSVHDDLINHGVAQLVDVLIRVHALAGGVGSHRAELSRGLARLGGHFSHGIILFSVDVVVR